LNNYKTETQGRPLIAKHINSRTHTVKSGCTKTGQINARNSCLRTLAVRRAVRSFLAVVYTLYAKPDAWIFPSTKMKGRTPLSASMMAADKIRPAAVKIGIRLEPSQRFGFHNFRHSLATFLINKGKDVKTIQGLLRHAKASTTLDLYSQAIDASKLAAQRDIALAITSQLLP
jgi:integrase